MDARNLAIVFGPTLVKKKDDDMASIVKDMSDQCRIIESIILHVSIIFIRYKIFNPDPWKRTDYYLQT